MQNTPLSASVEEIDFADAKLKYFDPLNGDFSIKFEFVELIFHPP